MLEFSKDWKVAKFSWNEPANHMYPYKDLSPPHFNVVFQRDTEETKMAEQF